jgi:CBS domain-containing protein
MTDRRDPYREDGGRAAAGGSRALQRAPWLEREDRDIERGYGEGEFERGGRPAGGYAQGGYDTHLHDHRSGGYRGQGYGSYGGGAYREPARRAAPERRSWRGDERSIREVMTPHAEVLDPDMTVRDAARRMRSDNLGAYPVGEFDRLVGMVTDRDIVVRAVANDRQPGTTTVREVMSRQVIYCFEDDEVEDVAEMMADHQVRRIPVLNRDRRLVGVVALADLGLTGQDAARRALEGISERSGAPRR